MGQSLTLWPVETMGGEELFCPLPMALAPVIIFNIIDLRQNSAKKRDRDGKC
jgi:hypothetical protein